MLATRYSNWSDLESYVVEVKLVLVEKAIAFSKVDRAP